MRTRHEVERDMNTPGLTGPTIPNADRLILELLLDIRELLTNPVITIDRVPPDYKNEDDDVGWTPMS